MKTTKSLKKMLILLLIVTGLSPLGAQEATKTVKKEFKVKENATLTVDNRFGKIHCNVWENNIINIEVTIKATAATTREAERMIENINIGISGNETAVKAVTDIKGKISEGKNSSISIDYTISMPASLNLNLTNKFGDIYLDRNSGASLINVDYGNLQVNTLTGADHKIVLKFSKGNLGSAENLEIDLSYSELFAGEIQNLIIDSKFSTFEVDKAGSISQNSQYDTNRLGRTKAITSNSKFSTITVGSISEMLNIDSKYGSFTVRKIEPGFREIHITNSFGNIELLFEPETSFILEAESNFGQVTVPRKSNVLIEEVSYTGKSYKGRIGKDDKPRSTVTISTRNGDVNLKMR